MPILHGRASGGAHARKRITSGARFGESVWDHVLGSDEQALTVA
jgi:hypothetical protein